MTDLAHGPAAARGGRVRLVVVGGHDSSGGAGVDADRAAAEELCAEVLEIVTARTLQDGGGLRELGAREPERWLGEARAALEALGAPGGAPVALKLGLLPEGHAPAAARLVGELRARVGDVPVVLDPVLAASAGGRFLSPGAARDLVRALGPLGLVWTPNLAEAGELAGLSPGALEGDLGARCSAARALIEVGAAAVCLKGGHGLEDPVRDLVLERGGGPSWIERPRVPGPGIRGSGCRHASALAIELARGAPLREAAARAGERVARAISRGGTRESERP